MVGPAVLAAAAAAAQVSLVAAAGAAAGAAAEDPRDAGHAGSVVLAADSILGMS